VNVITAAIPGVPNTKLRPRFSRYKGRVKTYDPQADDKKTVQWQLRSRMVGKEPLDGPVSLSCIFIFPKPKSRKKLKEVFHTVKPDLDNLIKWIGDVGNGILWHDDKQIVSISSVKIYGESPKTIITASKV